MILHPMMRKIFVFTFLFFSLHVAHAQYCLSALEKGESVKISDQEFGTIKLVWKSQSHIRFALTKGSPATEPELNNLLVNIYKNISEKCTSFPTAVWLYGTPELAVANVHDTPSTWIGWISKKNKTPVIKIQKTMLAAATNAPQHECLPQNKEEMQKKEVETLRLKTIPQPPMAKVVGTWAYGATGDNTSITIENFSGKYYAVFRSKYCGSGSKGFEIMKAGGEIHRKRIRIESILLSFTFGKSCHL